ncbi:tRNA (adenosine(37)-N6)-dimethylallyltransferase MiaA [Planktosalinus lacus]|uniref:tRNA dimethylallyltransferase n=1 Tax=Planktosalinus lacus TaxID=1526573 RepID=A0A8J2YAH8_9FLAO|nr:tRNA (adenosine(37)-N6)-dimethylallyltransferase MiaA [Planktosalinus lacus]GGD91535.1 tRNA dimethylallyltransferase [Planktosalinus lacus]
MKNQKYLVTIIGPTGIGKTSTSIALAKEFQSEIISADSRQFYKEMQIGTAVPNEKELTEVPHHFIQHISINQDYNVGDFESDALQLLKEKFKNHDILFMVGGSGLYIDAVLKGLDTFPKVNSQVRLDLQKLFLESGIEALQEKLKLLDPEYYEKVDKNNAHRLIRALEICIGTNKPYTSFLGKKNAGRNFTPIKIGLSAEREIIYNRINNRVNLMIENGLINEVKNLNNKKHLNALQTVGYTEMFAHLEGVITFEKAVEEIKKNSRRYAKRQLTWWRKDESIKWFEYDDKIENIINYIKLKTS